MSMSPAILSARLLLRPYTIDDVDEMHAVLLGDARAMEKIGGPLELAAARVAIVRQITAYQLDGLAFGPVLERASGRIVGEAGLVPLGGHGPEVELGYAFGPGHWGRGYATEIGRALLDEAFGALEHERVVAVTKEINVASRHVLDKLGFAPAGRRHEWGHEQLYFVCERPASSG